ncbi:MAG: YggS family pyridoxal phosphate-dependent enzyme [Gammaproteobacteria bacterium]
MTIAFNLEQVLQRIAKSVNIYRTDNSDVQLIAVSKTRPPDAIREAWAQGQRMFGENYVQEAVEKINALQDLDIEWHFIGPIQSNKTALIAQNFDWCQSVDRSKIARRLSAQRPDDKPPLNVCVQLNISAEETKSGTDETALWSLADEIATLEHLTLRGLMAIPERQTDFEQQRQTFNRMHSLFEQMQHRYNSVDTLSMGMSNDLEAAVAAGSTMVRIGTDIFGART